jgi:hypothetical protein
VFEREYLHDQAPDLAPETRYGISGVHIILPREGLRIGKGWVLGVGCWALGVGRWVLGVGCWALGVGRWVFEREYPDDGTSNSNSGTGSGIPQAHIRRPEEGWPIPRRRFLGVGC